MSKQKLCKNCENYFVQGNTFCPHCGQKSKDNLTFTVLFGNIIENYFSIDGRFFKSLLILLAKPGVIARKFVDGQRQKYLHPARFYLFVSLVFFFIFSFSIQNANHKMNALLKDGFEEQINMDSLAVAIDSLNRELGEGVILLHPDEQADFKDTIQHSSNVKEDKDLNVSFSFNRNLLDSLIAKGATMQEKSMATGMSEDASAFSRKFYAQLVKFYENQGGGILKVLYEMIPLVMFLLLPLFAILLNIFFYKKSTFTHHLVFSFYLFTFIFISSSILLLLNRLFTIAADINVFICLSFMIYVIIAIRNFYKSSWIGSIIKATLITALYILIGIPLASVGILLTGFMFY